MVLVELFNTGSTTKGLIKAGLLKTDHIESLTIMISRLITLEVFDLMLLHSVILKL